MNAGELIARLQQFPVDTTVVVNGYETGYDNPGIDEVDVEWGANEDEWERRIVWCSGRHEEATSATPATDLRHVIVIGRT